MNAIVFQFFRLSHRHSQAFTPLSLKGKHNSVACLREDFTEAFRRYISKSELESILAEPQKPSTPSTIIHESTNPPFTARRLAHQCPPHRSYNLATAETGHAASRFFLNHRLPFVPFPPNTPANRANSSTPARTCYPFSVADVFTKKKRSQVMAAIRSKGNKATELKLASILRAAHITNWRRHPPLPGRPDFAFRRARLAVFVDGCFWHGCRWHCRMPQDNREYWQRKISRNAIRDRATTQVLRRAGWQVLRIWAHSLRSPEIVIRRITSQLSAAPKRCNNDGTQR